VGMAGYRFSMKSRNHDSSTVAFIRVRNFRTLVDMDWAEYRGEWEGGGGGMSGGAGAGAGGVPSGGVGGGGGGGDEAGDAFVDPPEVRME
jgi:hypothetical protein